VTVYLDSLFILNWVANYLLLLVTAKVAGEPFHRLRMGAGGALGALFAALSFLPGGEWLFHPAVKIAAAVGMVLVGFGGSRHLLRAGVTFAGLSCALSGGVLLIGQLSGKGLSMRHGVLTTDMDVKAVLLAAAVCYGVLTLLFRRSGQHGGGELEPAVISVGGESILLTALHDTGNTLTDPATGREIHVRSDDTTSVMVEFADGTPGSALFSKCMLGHKNDLRVIVSGDRKEYFWHQERCDLLCTGDREHGNETIYVNQSNALPEVHPYIALPAGHAPGWLDAQKNALIAFYGSIESGSYLTGDVPYATFEDGVMGNRFVDACLESARQGQWIDL